MPWTKAIAADVPAILAAAREAVARMTKEGNPQWGRDYPGEDEFSEDIDRGRGYVLRQDGHIMAYVAIAEGPDPTYGAIEGAWLSDDPYLVLHRLFVADRGLGQGIGRSAFALAESLAKAAKVPALRADTHEKNPITRRLLAQEGFVPTGVIYVRDGSPRLAFEKPLYPGGAPGRYHTFLMDADETLLDFTGAQKEALMAACRHFGVEGDEALAASYAAINARCWRDFERGVVSKEDLVVRRFAIFTATHGLPGDAPTWEDLYQSALGQSAATMPHALETVKGLAARSRVAVITNGVAATQISRMALAGIAPHLEALLVSETIGAQKPDPRYFAAVKEALSLPSWDGVLVVGDSPFSDIKGGMLSGIATCRYNPGRLPDPPGITPTFTIRDLRELLPLAITP